MDTKEMKQPNVVSELLLDPGLTLNALWAAGEVGTQTGSNLIL
jgi:hypothetical protein